MMILMTIFVIFLREHASVAVLITAAIIFICPFATISSVFGVDNLRRFFAVDTIFLESNEIDSLALV